MQIPKPDARDGLAALNAILRERHMLAALETFEQRLGSIFKITLPIFRPIVFCGAEAHRYLLVEAADDFLWRPKHDPVTKLLRRGLLVQDGTAHHHLRTTLMPPLHKQRLPLYLEKMIGRTDQVINQWDSSQSYDMLAEMRRVALLILMDTLYETDFTPDLDRLWKPIHRLLKYISPGLWILWSNIPRFGYQKAIRTINDYFYDLIAKRRQQSELSHDLIGTLIQAGFDDDLIRDQLITLFIAGHDTSTALLTWALYLLAKHPDVAQRAGDEIQSVLGTKPPTLESLHQLPYLENIIKETLRLYPPIHLGNRIAARDLHFQDYHIPKGTRVVYSIYLIHRSDCYWKNPHTFDPDRFVENPHPSPYVYLPFGGGKRNCIGSAFAQLEAKVVLARILQRFDLTLISQKIRPYMGATLEPYPHMLMKVSSRTTRPES